MFVKLLCLAVSSSGAWAFEISPVPCHLSVSVPCSRRFLYIVNLDAPTEGHRKISRQSKWDIGAVQWNPHDSYAYYFAASVSPLTLKAVELIPCPGFLWVEFCTLGRQRGADVGMPLQVP